MKRTKTALVFINVLWMALLFSLYVAANEYQPNEETARREKLFTDAEYEQFYSSVRFPTQAELLSRSPTAQETLIHTSDGTPIIAYTYTEMTPQEKADLSAEMYEQIVELYSAFVVEQIAPPSDLYNCHSYAWYNRTYQTNNYWINSAEEFIGDVHTVPIPDSQAAVGDIVAYIRIDGYVHSAVIDEILPDGTIICISKWGRYGLYRHNINHVPQSYKDIDGVNYDIFRYVQDEHLTTVFTTSATHIFECQICDYYIVGEPHEFVYSNPTFNNHTVTCTVCFYSYTENHSAIYIDLDYSTHKVYCYDCFYSHIEAHTSNVQGTQCIFCLRTGNFSGTIIMKREEFELLE